MLGLGFGPQGHFCFYQNARQLWLRVLPYAVWLVPCGWFSLLFRVLGYKGVI